MAQYGLPRYDATLLTGDRAVADYYEACVAAAKNTPLTPKLISNWVTGELFRLLKESQAGMEDCLVKPEGLIELLSMVGKGTINPNTAKDVLEEMFKTGKSPEKIVEEKGLVQISDEKLISEICDRVIAENPGPAQDFRNGKQKAIGFLIGQVMKFTKGKANPRLVNEILRKKLSE